MSIHLTGGGWPFLDDGAVFVPFLWEAEQRGVRAGRIGGPRVAIVLVRDGDGPNKFDELSTALGQFGRIEPVAVLASYGSNR